MLFSGILFDENILARKLLFMIGWRENVLVQPHVEKKGTKITNLGSVYSLNICVIFTLYMFGVTTLNLLLQN